MIDGVIDLDRFSITYMLETHPFTAIVKEVKASYSPSMTHLISTHLLTSPFQGQTHLVAL